MALQELAKLWRLYRLWVRVPLPPHFNKLSAFCVRFVEIADDGR